MKPLHRTEREKESSGLPDLPTPGRLVELEYAVIEDRKVRSMLRNVSAIEQQARRKSQCRTLAHPACALLAYQT